MPEQNFETSLASLERIVRDLERGDLSLEESLKLFEEGVRLSRECQQRLDQAERRIEVLLRDADGNPRVEPLDGKNLQAGDEPKVKRRIVFSDDSDETDESPF